MMALQSRLDKREITRNLSRLSRKLDENFRERRAVMFAHDLTFDDGSGEKEGMFAIEAQMRQLPDVCETNWVLHADDPAISAFTKDG